MKKDVRCPYCGSKMDVRTARKGINAGSDFYLCSRYPECKGRFSLDGTDGIDSPPENGKDVVRQDAGEYGDGSLRGRFGEPYCSEECLRESVVRIRGAFEKRIQGVCVICHSSVALGRGRANTACIAIPYRGKMGDLFVCEKCISSGRRYIAGIKQCCMCDRAVGLDAGY